MISAVCVVPPSAHIRETVGGWKLESMGQKVWLLDLSQPTANVGLGVGLDVGSTHVSNNQIITQGVWTYAGTTSASGEAGCADLAGN